MHVAVTKRGLGFATKAALKSAVAAGENVLFRDTSMFNPLDIRADDLAQGQTLYLVGPFEYERKWYAQVKSHNGKVVVR